MAQSPEYPDLKWMPPRAYGAGRDGKAVRYIVIHYTAGAERNTSAESGAVYDQQRTNGVSTHYFVDSDSVVQCVHTRNRANAARHRGNRLGIQYELCGTVQTRAQWLDATSLPTLRNAARQVARDCKKYDIPVRRLTVAETRRAWTAFPSGPKGIVGHVDCTNAYPEDGGDHTDPGTQFPWDVFLDMVRAEMAGKTAAEEIEVPIATDKIELTIGSAKELGGDYTAGSEITGATALNLLLIYAARANKNAAAALAAVAQLASKDVVDEQALAAAVAAEVVANLPDGTDQISQEEVTAAVKAAFSDAFSG